MVNSRLPVEDPRLCVQITYLMRQRACTNRQSITDSSSPELPTSIRISRPVLTLCSYPAPIRILECPRRWVAIAARSLSVARDDL
jgi:hypothetical protein